MKDTRVFLAFWLINNAIFYFAPFLLTGLMATGNARLSAFMASLISGFLLTLAVAAVEPTLKYLNFKLKGEWQYLITYLTANVLGVWVIARYADLTGVGVANFWVAIILGVIFNLGQWGVWKYIKPAKKS